jgi:hypothetical protein
MPVYRLPGESLESLPEAARKKLMKGNMPLADTIAFLLSEVVQGQ